MGLSFEDMEHLTYGMIEDMFIEQSNDGEEYAEEATQADFDNF